MEIKLCQMDTESGIFVLQNFLSNINHASMYLPNSLLLDIFISLN